MSWHYLRVQEEESLQDICSGGELLQPLKSKITHAEFYCNGKLMDSYLDSLSGTTFAHSMEILGEEKSMSSQVDFHAKIFLPPEKEQDLMEKDQDSGEKWQGSFTKYSPDSCSWKTHQCSLLGDLDEFSETWPQWGLMRNGECWEQQTLAQTISGIVFGLNPSEINSPPPPHIYIWTTPTAHMSKETNAPSEHRRNTPTLTAQVNQRWPTPDASAHKYRLSGNSQQSNSLMALAGGKLNPDWTEWLMGWPPGWTDLKPLAMDKSHCVPLPHGES
jgi:hypothetical protein